MNENIDLTKILKDCPKGWKFYSTLYGEVEFEKIKKESEYPIVIITKHGNNSDIKSDGRYYGEYDDGECTLFPSKDQRDWSKFSAPWYKDEKKLVKPKFKVGDKIVNVPMKYWGAPVTQGTILKITDDKYIFTDGSRMSISNQDSWELVSDKKPKFDPKTLKPFDKVLVKDGYSQCWRCNLFSHTETEYPMFPYTTHVGHFYYCIPYNDETKHLLGTTDEAPEYYKYWED